MVCLSVTLLYYKLHAYDFVIKEFVIKKGYYLCWTLNYIYMIYYSSHLFHYIFQIDSYNGVARSMDSEHACNLVTWSNFLPGGLDNFVFPPTMHYITCFLTVFSKQTIAFYQSGRWEVVL